VLACHPQHHDEETSQKIALIHGMIMIDHLQSKMIESGTSFDVMKTDLNGSVFIK